MRDQPSPLLRAAALGLGALILPACAKTNYLQAGSYTARKPEGSNVVLTIDADKLRVTFTPPGAPALKRRAEAWDRSKWPTLCPRGMVDSSSEVLDLGPEPLQLGATRVDHPLLVANCVGQPSVDLRSMSADGAPKSGPAPVVFDR